MNEITNEQKIIFAKNEEAVAVMRQILQESRTMVTQLVADTEWQTLVNSLTLEFESRLVERTMIYLAELKVGKTK